jgi:YjbE family integral membrane protein
MPRPYRAAANEESGPVTGMILDQQFFLGLLQIIWIDLLLSGDNAVVIALACRSLPPKQRRWGIICGAGAAIVLRVIFAVFVVYLLTVPYLKIIGSLLLFWIAVKLILPEEPEHAESVRGGNTLLAAVRTIVIADAVMSLDNVIAIAAASHGRVELLVLGLLISIPLIVYGSTLVLKLLERFPILIVAGGGLLGYIAGDVLVTDPVLIDWVAREAHYLHTAAPIAGAVVVIAVGLALARLIEARRRRKLDLVS